MFRASIAYTDLTVNSACDELFPGVEDVDAQATHQLRVALDAFEEGVFEFHTRAAQSASAGAQADASSGTKARGHRRTRREQAYANRIPEDRQFFRPVEVQSAEWAAFKPHLWLRGRQVKSADPAHLHQHQHHAATLGVSTAPGGSQHPAAASVGSVGAQGAASVPPTEPSCASGGTGSVSELVVVGSKIRLAPAPPGGEADEEFLGQQGDHEEVFVVQHDEWEAHVPTHLRRRRGRPRDEKAVAIGLPPLEPRNAALYDIAETLLPEVWTRLGPLLGPVLTRLAEERRANPNPSSSRAASRAFRGGNTSSAGRAGGGGGGGGGPGGEFEIITFSSDGEEEAPSRDGLMGGSDAFVAGMGLGMGRAMGFGSDDSFGDGDGGGGAGGWPGLGLGGDYGASGSFDGGPYSEEYGGGGSSEMAALRGGRGHGGGPLFGDDVGVSGSRHATDPAAWGSYDSEGEDSGVGSLGDALPRASPSPSQAPAGADSAVGHPITTGAAVPAAAALVSVSESISGGDGSRVAVPGPPPVLPRDQVTAETELTGAGIRMGPGMQQMALAPAARGLVIAPVVPPPVAGSPGPSPRASPSHLYPQLQPASQAQAQLRLSYGGESSSAGGGVLASLPLALLQPSYHALGSPRGSQQGLLHANQLAHVSAVGALMVTTQGSLTHGSFGSPSPTGQQQQLLAASAATASLGHVLQHHTQQQQQQLLGVPGPAAYHHHQHYQPHDQHPQHALGTLEAVAASLLAAPPLSLPDVAASRILPPQATVASAGTGTAPGPPTISPQHLHQPQLQPQPPQLQAAGVGTAWRMPSLSRNAGPYGRPAPASAAGCGTAGTAGASAAGPGAGLSAAHSTTLLHSSGSFSSAGSGALEVSGVVVPGSATGSGLARAGAGVGVRGGRPVGGGGGGGGALQPGGAQPAACSPVAALSQYSSRFLAGPAGAGAGAGAGTGGAGADHRAPGTLSASSSLASLPPPPYGPPAATAAAAGPGAVGVRRQAAGTPSASVHVMPPLAAAGAVASPGRRGSPSPVALHARQRPRRQPHPPPQPQQPQEPQPPRVSLPTDLRRTYSGGASGSSSPVLASAGSVSGPTGLVAALASQGGAGGGVFALRKSSGDVALLLGRSSLTGTPEPTHHHQPGAKGPSLSVGPAAATLTRRPSRGTRTSPLRRDSKHSNATQQQQYQQQSQHQQQMQSQLDAHGLAHQHQGHHHPGQSGQSLHNPKAQAQGAAASAVSATAAAAAAAATVAPGAVPSAAAGAGSTPRLPALGRLSNHSFSLSTG